MSSFLIYILNASIGVMIISLPYYILLRRDANLNFKRFFLLGGLILAFVLPFLKFSLSTKAIFEMPTFFLDLDSVGNEDNIAMGLASQTKSVFQWKYLLAGLYILGIVLLFFKNFISIISWMKLKRNSDSEQNRVLYSEKNEVFSLFRTIHLPKSILNSEEHSSILIHEQAHVRQLHFIDLIISEIAILITWFNPFTWLINRMIKENHEHLADREVLSHGVNPARYRALLLNQTLGVRVFRLGHSFNYSLTKKRFEMMKNKNSKRLGLVKIMILLPALLFSLGFLNITRAQDGKVKGNVKFSDTNEPATGTSIIIMGTTMGTVSDEEGNFELLLTKKSQLVFSYVGYETVIRDCTPGETISIRLKPAIIDLKPEQKEKNFSNQSKVAIDKDIQPKRVGNISELNSEDIDRVRVLKDKAIIAEKYPGIESSRGVIEVISKNHKSDETPEEMFFVVEDMPQYPGGNEAMKEFIYSNLNYPSKAKKNKMEGSVIVQFEVNKMGEVGSVTVVQTSNKIFSASAIEVIENMPNWTPGMQRGKAVKVMFTIPVLFKISES